MMKKQTRITWIIELFLVILALRATLQAQNESEFQLVVNELPYPENRDISYTNRISQSYYVLQFVLDNSEIDLCDSSLIDTRLTIQNSSAFLNNSICIEYFCECSLDSNVCLNLTTSLVSNTTFRMEYFRMINFCIHCNNFHSQEFRKAIASSNSNQCLSKFPSYEALQTSMLSHCNHNMDEQSIHSIIANSSVVNTTNFNIGIIDWRFFQPGVYYSSIYTSKQSNITTDNTLHLYNTLFVSDLMNPVMCWCRNELGKRLAFQCADAYYNFILPFKYMGSPLIIILLFSINLILFIVYNIIPLTLTKIHAINSRLKTSIANQASSTFLPNIILKICFEELLFTDLRPSILLLLLCSTLLILLENVILFIWNFRFFYDVVVHWGHIVDLLGSSKTKRTLSRRNWVLLAIMYAFNVFALIVGVVGCIILEGTFPLFAVAAICMIVCPNILMVVFSAYSWIIFKRLKRSQKNISELKFTKKMILFNLVLIMSFLAAAVLLPTYVVAWDLYGIYVGLFRSMGIDVTCFVILLFITYILANDVEISKHYSSSVSDILLCKWFEEIKMNRRRSSNHNITTHPEDNEVKPVNTDSNPSPVV
ncbi:hypothetical protein C9374_006900 [Naegleria lovaniensis]|uniref:G-protein coupled receptors family 2 profile 2 domain-containing protein n=1 Tax=Naegleria lovaniensis TaxID=51637 RepID=A0AA88KS74_NAELO|nr:uncharacterized protein C9374_006900 [Naegleria lovaniensis]KAG2393369.1 hypothetical protein C9374_006900 [Naegleria lovaniensis]